MNNHSTAPSPLEQIQGLLRERHFEAARDLAHQWFVREPETADAAYFMAVSHRALGETTAARDTLLTLLAKEPGHSRALQEYGHLLRDAGQWSAAQTMYRRATRENPSLLASWQGLQKASNELNDAESARTAAQQADWLKALPQPLLIAMDLMARGRVLAAEKLIKRFMIANPQHVEGMRLLADVAVRLGATGEATLLLDTAAQLAPKDQRIRVDRIQLLRRCLRSEEARSEAQALADYEPQNPQFQSLAAIEAMHLGDYDEALERFAKVLGLLPDDPVTLTSRGHALKTSGQTDAAIDSYRAAIAARSEHGEAWYSLANLKTYRFSASDIDVMTALTADSGVDAASQTYLHFALGKAHEDAEAWEQSFEHYNVGNRIKRQRSTYSREQIAEEFDRQIQHCTEALYEPDRGTGHGAGDPIFVVGLPRAGSTLIEQILASHSQIDGTLELPNILSLAQSLRRRDGGTAYPENLWDLSTEERQEMGAQFIEQTRIHRDSAPLFIDKMPNNFRHIGLIKLILPNAHIIDARRHPMACCFSGFKQLFAEGQEFSYDLSDMGHYYRDYVRLMDHWQSVFPGQILQINNEDVISDLDGQIHRMLDYLGLPFEEGCLRYWETDRAIKTPSSEQVRKPVSDKGQHQWRHYAPWLQPLRDALGPELSRLSQ